MFGRPGQERLPRQLPLRFGHLFFAHVYGRFGVGWLHAQRKLRVLLGQLLGLVLWYRPTHLHGSVAVGVDLTVKDKKHRSLFTAQERQRLLLEVADKLLAERPD